MKSKKTGRVFARIFGGIKRTLELNEREKFKLNKRKEPKMEISSSARGRGNPWGRPKVSPGRKGQTEFSEFILKIIGLMLFIVFLVAGILQMSQFKVTVNENSFDRLGIDFGENVLAAPCLAEKKGLFNETMLNSELSYFSSHPEKKGGISCLKTSALLVADIETANKEWFYTTAQMKVSYNKDTYTIFEFPAALSDSSGNIVPAKVSVIDYNRYSAKYVCNDLNGGYNCYNCLSQASCEKEGCVWDVDICKP